MHNKYIFSIASRAYGEVLVLRGKAPTFPITYPARPVMEDGEMRYWSFCTNVETGQYLACRQDDAFPLDGQRRYTLALSTAASRPSNALERCGVTWLPLGPSTRTVLIVRHMLPRDDFAHSIQKVGANGTEEQVMGDYYPRGTYYATTTEVEKLGCRPPEFAAASRGCLRRTLRVRRRRVGPVRAGTQAPRARPFRRARNAPSRARVALVRGRRRARHAPCSPGGAGQSWWRARRGGTGPAALGEVRGRGGYGGRSRNRGPAARGGLRARALRACALRRAPRARPLGCGEG